MNRDVEEEEARHIAKRNGFSYVMPVLRSKREFHFEHKLVQRARTKRSVDLSRKLKTEPAVSAAIQQPGYLRSKRGYKQIRGIPLPDLTEHSNMAKTDAAPNDPLYPKQWYINNTGQAGGVPKLDLNVEPAWALGFTGKGVTTAIMDDGIDYMHPDLADNFNAEASYDFSSNDPFPYPRYTDDWFNSHGTRCAGEIAAMKNNEICGVGVAYESKVAGLRMLDQPYMTDLIEANSMGHMPQNIDIYSASWGPTDDGRTVDGPRNATMRAIVKGVNEGRNGSGSIYVWASGDGGPNDDCNCDGYAASMWTISINSATNDGQTASYDESCSSTLASTFSNGKTGDQDAGVATTDLYGKCTTRHSGTSAAAPEAAGVFALALEANNKLTWRDVQHLTVLTSKRNHLDDHKHRHNWTINGAGLEFNHLFGYGVLDAGDMVDMARNWITVPERWHCSADVITGNYPFSTGNPLTLTIDTTACQGQENQVNYLEHVQAFITLRATRRGDVTIHLVSPMNTTSMLLGKRVNDGNSKSGFTKWPFMTTHAWAENPKGRWRLIISLDGNEPQSGTLLEWNLLLHGTRTSPYVQQTANLLRHSKLALVKRQHETDRKFSEF
ncbi:hypothetical protein HELRODRAFT_96355 [Helobdella robusta]|uniref:Neuroendocrine convertase 2 n=1 Tax=Helobdella robusta TaxID=6412 RepID=T1G9B6_HELRO|nr:hypothetical protein HELRODRAFT_96355 [Helobdella robusta]ESN91678.1 hypothetical protein HELRODRAFT_96355 [Helobdella robusta]